MPQDRDTPLLVSKIIHAIRSRGMTQEQVEESLRLARGRLSKWVGGIGEPSAIEVWRIAQYTGVEVGFLLDPHREIPSGALPLEGSVDDPYELPRKMMLKLGPDESFRRLARDERPVVAPPSESALPGTLHGQVVPLAGRAVGVPSRRSSGSK